MIKKLILENYIPLLSSGINRVELDFPLKVNLLISQSGVGKSSSLRELNPLPPENGNYKKGRKYVEFSYNGVEYILDSYTGVGNGHSFKVVKNGEATELNKGGTYSAQRDLVYNHFALDNRLIKASAGLKVYDRLTGMTPNARKELLMQIYPNDTTYAMRVYSKLRTERNELRAAIKNQVARYAEESNKLKTLSEVGIEDLSKRIESLERDLREALLIRGDLGKYTSDPQLQSKVNEFNILTDTLTNARLGRVDLTTGEISDRLNILNSTLLQHRLTARELETQIAELSKNLEGLDDFLKNPDSFKEHHEQILVDLELKQKELSEIEEHLFKLPVFEDKHPFKGLQDVSRTFSDYLGRVTLASDESLTGEQFKSYMSRLEVTSNDLRETSFKLKEVTHKLEHYNRADLVECPDCSSKFKVGVTEVDLNNLKREEELLSNKVSGLEKVKVELELKIENDQEWYNSMNQLFSFIRENNQVKELSELVKVFNIGKQPSITLQNALHRFMRRSKLLSDITLLDEEKTIINARLSAYNREGLYLTAEQIKDFEKSLFITNNLITNTLNEISSLERELKSRKDYNYNLSKLSLLKEEVLKGLESDVNVKLRTLLDSHISNVTSEKETLLVNIIKNRSLNSVVESIDNDIKKLKKRLSIVEILIDGLCPNKGLIGKMMGEFIENLCGNMNAVISKIWNTTLYIKPCSKENGDLTYKFPVVTSDGEVTPDVSDCSGGESDIMDWAFRYTLLNYVKFPLPLIMDEVGTHLDEIKRANFFNFIKDYTEQKDSRQLFLVSHFFVVNGVFSDANIIGFNAEGLTVSGEINKHTKIN